MHFVDIDPYYSEMPGPLSGFDLLNDAALIYLSRYFVEARDRGFLELDINALELAMCIHLHDVLLLHRDVNLESIGIFRESEFFASQELGKLVDLRRIADHPRAVGNRG